MASLADLQDDPEFVNLSPQAQQLVVDSISKEDQGFKSLSPEAQVQVKKRLVKASVDSGPTLQEPAPLTPYLIDEAKKGLAGIPALAAEIPKSIPNIGPFVKLFHAATGDQFGPQKTYERAANLLDVQNLPTPTNEYGKPSKSNEYLGALARFAGAGAIPGIGVVSAAEQKLIAALVEMASTGVSAMSSVEGKEIGGDIAHKFGVDRAKGEHIGELLGSLVGPGAVGYLGHLAQKTGGAAATKVGEVTGVTGISKEAQERAGKTMAVRQLKESLEAAPESGANLAETVELQQKIPGFSPTLGEASGAPGVVAIEQNIAGATPQSLAKAVQRREANTEAVSNFAQEKFPASEASPTQGVKDLYQVRLEQNRRRLNAIEEQINTLASLPTADNAIVGNKLRTLREEALNVTRKLRDEKYEAVSTAANRAGIKEDVKDVQTAMREVAGSDENAAQIMPALYSDLSQAIKKYAPAKSEVKILGPNGQPARVEESVTEVPFAALHSMLKRAGQDRTRALMVGDDTRAYHIGQIQDLLRTKVNKFEGPEFGHTAELLRDANKFYKEKYRQVFKEGLGGRMARFNRFGDTTPDEKVVSSLVLPAGGQQGITDFFNMFGHSNEAKILLEHGFMDMFTKAVVRDGEIKPALVEAFKRTHSAQLDAMPGFKQALGDINAINDALLARRGTIQAQQKAFDQTALAKIAGIRNPQEAVEAALTEHRMLGALVSQAGKVKGGSDALARSVALAVANQKDPYAFLSANAPMLRRELEKLGPGHFANLQILAQANKIAERTTVPGHVNLEKLSDVGERAVGTSVKGLFSRALNVKKGYMSGGYAAFDIGGRYIYKIKTEEAAKLMEAAIYDPELAKVLVAMPKMESKEALNSLRAHALSHGIRVIAVEKGR